MDGAINSAIQQRLLDFLGEEALAADLQQAAILDAVTGGGDADQRSGLLRLGRCRAEGGGDGALHHPGLGERQLRAARADADRLPDHGKIATSRGEWAAPSYPSARG